MRSCRHTTTGRRRLPHLCSKHWPPGHASHPSEDQPHGDRHRHAEHPGESHLGEGSLRRRKRKKLWSRHFFPNDSDINTKAAARQIVTASPGATTNHIQRDGRLLFSYIDMMTHNPTPPETLTRSRCLQLLFTGHRKLYGMKKEGLRFYNSPPGTDFTGRTCCAIFKEKK